MTNSSHGQRRSAATASLPTGGAIGEAAQLRLTRRDALKVGGLASAMALFAGCPRGREQFSVPLVGQPEDVVPGRSSWYASACHGCAAQCGVTVKVRDGRPIKLEGTPEHPLTRGGLCAIGQAQVRSLYDSDRLASPRVAGENVSYSAVDAQVRTQLGRLRDDGRAVALITPTVTSPTTRTLIAELIVAYPNVRHVAYDAPSLSATREAHRAAYGAARTPEVRLDRARVIVGVEADFLGAWMQPVAHARQYALARDPDRAGGMARHVQFESRLSLTGANADRRIAIAPAQVRAVLAALLARVSQRRGVSRPWSRRPVCTVAETTLDAVAQELAEHAGRALVVCGVNDVTAQVLAAAINDVLGSVGASEDSPVAWHREVLTYQGDDAGMRDVIGQAAAGELGGAIFWGVNPVYDHPLGATLAAAIPSLALSAALATHADETASLAHAVLPLPHFLETWDDGEPVAGLLSLTQPTLRPLFGARPGPESLLRWLGRDGTYRDRVIAHWRAHVYPAFVGGGAAIADLADVTTAAGFAFDRFWTAALQAGFVELPRGSASGAADEPPALRLEALPSLAEVAEADDAADGDGLALVAFVSPVIGAGRHANNPWLQECSEPISKVTWDNHLAVHPDTAARLGLREGYEARVSVSAGGTNAGGADGGAPEITLPVLFQPGTHPGVVAVALGYGREAAGRFGTGVGVNVAPLLPVDGDGRVIAHGVRVTVTPLDTQHQLGRTQTIDSQVTPLTGYDRNLLREASHEGYAHDKSAGNPAPHPATTLWPGHAYAGKKWAMVVDLSRCVGCAACVMACQAENNTPVVGREEIGRMRGMHWMRIDRYFIGEGDDLHAGFMPLMCQQCDNAPCETVCPVAATTHSSEGLNDQVYNRCVGTRYCANNCPYKARRFNWFEYDRSNSIENLGLNPDVTVRSRGVMEKCTFCVQRISDAKAQARADGRDIVDGEIAPACAQSCPTQAIVFGDENDAESEVSRRQQDARAYRLLPDVNTLPSVAYLTHIRHTPAGDGADHDQHPDEPAHETARASSPTEHSNRRPG